MQVRRILVPVDYSEPSRRAVQWALWLVGQVGGQVEILHVAPRPFEYHPLGDWIWGKERREHELEGELRTAAEQAFEKFLAELPESERHKVGTRLELGVPFKVILSVVEQGDYDMLVMGTHGRSGAEHVLMGSTTERVLRQCDIPVLTVR